MKHPKKERTFVILKPDTIQRGLVGEIIKRVEQIGLKIVALKMVQANEEIIFKHYNKNDDWFQRKGQGVIDNKNKLGMPIEKTAIEYGKDIIHNMVHYMAA